MTRGVDKDASYKARFHAASAQLLSIKAEGGSSDARSRQAAFDGLHDQCFGYVLSLAPILTISMVWCGSAS